MMAYSLWINNYRKDCWAQGKWGWDGGIGFQKNGGGGGGGFHLEYEIWARPLTLFMGAHSAHSYSPWTQSKVACRVAQKQESTAELTTQAIHMLWRP